MKVLVPLDFSKEAEKSLEFAKAEVVRHARKPVLIVR